MKKEYKFYNRYGLDIKLEQIDGSQYMLVTNCEYMSISQNEDKSINYIDPEGGPVFVPDSSVEGINIKNITEKVIDGKTKFIFDISLN